MISDGNSKWFQGKIRWKEPRWMHFYVRWVVLSGSPCFSLCFNYTVLTLSFRVSVKLILSPLVFDGCVKWISFRFFVQGYLCQVVATVGMVHCVTNASGFLATYGVGESSIFELCQKSNVHWDDFHKFRARLRSIILRANARSSVTLARLWEKHHAVIGVLRAVVWWKLCVPTEFPAGKKP